MTQKDAEIQTLTPFNFAGELSDPGPRPGVGGWGLPGEDGSRSPNAKLGPIVGYAMEKIIRSFGLLRGLTVEGEDLQKSLKNLSISAPGVSRRGGDSKRKKALEALEQAKSELETGTSPLSLALLQDEDLLTPLYASEKSDLIALLAQQDLEENAALQSAVMHILRNAGSAKELNELLNGIGGYEASLKLFRDHNLGGLIAVAEYLGVAEWHPPFHHAIFTGEGDIVESSSTHENPFEAFQTQVSEDAQSLMNEDFISRFITGDITASELFGFNREELYMIAQRGYDLLQEGKLERARAVYEGLVFMDPYDPYFYTVLGSVQQKQEAFDDAVACYSMGIQLQPWNINALANRGEILFNQGRLSDALSDFQRVLYYDPEDASPSTMRTKALLLAIKEIVEQKAQEGEAEAPEATE